MATPVLLWKSGTLLGLTGIITGAFGAHAMKARLGPKVASWETASHYLIYNGLALMAISQHAVYSRHRGPLFILAGTLTFSGSIFALLLASPRLRFLGPVTPVGGLLMMGGWLSLLF